MHTHKISHSKLAFPPKLQQANEIQNYIDIIQIPRKNIPDNINFV